MIVYDHGSTRVATTFDASVGEGPGVNGVTVDGSALVIGRNGDRNTIGLDTFPLSGSAFGANLFSDAKYDADEFHHRRLDRPRDRRALCRRQG